METLRRIVVLFLLVLAIIIVSTHAWIITLPTAITTTHPYHRRHRRHYHRDVQLLQLYDRNRNNNSGDYNKEGSPELIQQQHTRRKALQCLATNSVVLLTTLATTTASAATTSTNAAEIGEATATTSSTAASSPPTAGETAATIPPSTDSNTLPRRLSSSSPSIPGFGPTDVLFPSFMLGKWYLTRDIVTSTDPRLDGMLLPFTVKYPVRFIPSSIDPKYVVADRGYNQASLERALNKALGSGQRGGTSSSSIGSTSSSNMLGRNNNNNFIDPIQSLEWTETNPNVMTITMMDGSRYETKVTKRATDKSPDGLGISTSEFQRYTVEQDNNNLRTPSTGSSTSTSRMMTMMIPTISARRVVTKWKIWDPTNVDGIELIYDMGLTSGDPMLMTTTTTPSSAEDVIPHLISKARIHMDRIVDDDDDSTTTTTNNDNMAAATTAVS